MKQIKVGQDVTVTLPERAARGTLLTVNGVTYEAVYEGEHFFWEQHDDG